MISIRAEITFNKEEKCLICKKMTKVVYYIKTKDACYCGYCFGKLYHNDTVIINQDCNEIISKSTDDYLREYLQAQLKATNDKYMLLKGLKLWCERGKEEKTIDSAINFIGGNMESYQGIIESLESELEEK